MARTPQAEKIAEYYHSGLGPTEVATELGIPVVNVTKMFEAIDAGKEQAGTEPTSPSTRTIGSEMAVLGDIIREASTTKKVSAIVRAFDNQMPDDYTTLARLCSRARIPIADIAFIVENWARHRGTDLDSEGVNEVLERAKSVSRTSAKKAKEEVTVKSVEDLEKEEADHYQKRIQTLRQRQILRDLRSDIGGASSQASAPTVKRVTKRPQVDAEGNLKMDPDGNLVYDITEEEGPSMSLPAQSGGMGDWLPLMMQQNTGSQQLVNTLMGALVDRANQPPPASADSKKDDMLMKIMEMQRDKEISEMRSNQDRQMDELKSMMKEKDLEERYLGQMGMLQEEIKNLQNQNITDERFRLQLQSQLTGRLIDEVSGAKDTLGGAMAGFLKESVEDRRHLRHLEQMRAAQQMGLDPSSFKKHWEEERVPSVSDEDFTTIMSGV